MTEGGRGKNGHTRWKRKQPGEKRDSKVDNGKGGYLPRLAVAKKSILEKGENLPCRGGE